MARSLFSGRPGDFLALPPSANSGFVKAAASLSTGTAWSAVTGGTHYTDLQTAAGVGITTLSTDADGAVVAFYGPDSVDRVWVDFGGTRRLLESQNAIANIVAAALTGVGVTGDTATAGFITTAGTATRVALDARYASGSGGSGGYDGGSL